MNNKMELRFPGISANEGFARICAAAFASQLDPTLEEIADIKTAISEAVTNAIVHAYQEKGGVDLNLSNPPAFTRVSSTAEALDLPF